jgi:hypothetical protein
MIQAVEQIMKGTDAARFMNIPEQMRHGVWRIIAVPIIEEPVKQTADTVADDMEQQKRDALAADVWAKITEINSHYPKETRETRRARSKKRLAEIEQFAAIYEAKKAQGTLTDADCLKMDNMALEAHYLEKCLEEDVDV